MQPLVVGDSGGSEPGVMLSNINVHAQLSPDQARSLAVALLERAAAAERLPRDNWPDRSGDG